MSVVALSHFRKILYIVLKLHIIIIYRLRSFGFKFGQNRLKRLNFFWTLNFLSKSRNILPQKKKLYETGDPHPENFVYFS